MIENFNPLFRELLIKLSKGDRWKNNSSLQKAVKVGYSILNDEIVEENIIKLAINKIKQETHEENDELILALMAILYSEFEESIEDSIKWFQKWAKCTDKPTQKAIAAFMAAVRLTEIHDFSNLLKDGYILLEHFTDNVTTVLWTLCIAIDIRDYQHTFSKFIQKAKELSSQPIDLFEAWYFYTLHDYSRALELYLQAKNRLEKEMPVDELADLWYTITQCYLNMPVPNIEKALEAINNALQFDSILQEYQNDNSYLTIRAKIYWLMKEKEKAITDIKHVLEYDAENDDAIELMQKIQKN